MRGEFVSISGGTLRVRGIGGEAVCSVDRRTGFEVDNQRATADALRPGDRLLIVVDRTPTSCYAQTVRVIDSSAEQSATETLAPRGEMTLSGTVLQVEHGTLTMRTRQGATRTILLRRDTRFLADGQRVSTAELKPLLRVFVRAGTNLDNELEAYQVIWGRILPAR